MGWFERCGVESAPRFNARNRSTKNPVSSDGFNWELATPYEAVWITGASQGFGEEIALCAAVGRCKLDPSLKAHLVSNFDCGKGCKSAFNLKP